MGYTSFTIERVTTLINQYKPSNVLDLGAQNNYSGTSLPAPYMSEWYRERGIIYQSIDINGENNSMPLDLSLPFEKTCVQLEPNHWAPNDTLEHGELALMHYGMLVDAGTSEHVGKNGAFDWEAIYNCWKTKYDLLKPGYVMYNENPKTGNWPGHGFNYYTQLFYEMLANHYELFTILEIGEHPAMGNTTNGWNVYCSLQRIDDRPFITLDEFKLLPLKTE